MLTTEACRAASQEISVTSRPAVLCLSLCLPVLGAEFHCSLLLLVRPGPRHHRGEQMFSAPELISSPTPPLSARPPARIARLN